mgnify:CR=1 FL=1
MKYTSSNFSIIIYDDNGKHLATVECTGQCTLREYGDIEKALRQVMTDATPKPTMDDAAKLNAALNSYIQGA